MRPKSNLTARSEVTMTEEQYAFIKARGSPPAYIRALIDVAMDMQQPGGAHADMVAKLKAVIDENRELRRQLDLRNERSSRRYEDLFKQATGETP